MNLQTFAFRSWVGTYNEADKKRLRRTVQILALFWLGAVLVGLLMPDGSKLQALQPTTRFLIGDFDGVMQAASRSFDPNYIETFAAFCLSWSVFLALASLFWLPRGSHLTFLGWRPKLTMALLGGLMLAVAWLVPEATQRELSSRGGRASVLLLLGTSSRLGAIMVLGTLWGFGQLFFFQGLRIILISPVRA